MAATLKKVLIAVMLLLALASTANAANATTTIASKAAVGDACQCTGGANGTYVSAQTTTAAASATTVAAATTTAAATTAANTTTAAAATTAAPTTAANTTTTAAATTMAATTAIPTTTAANSSAANATNASARMLLGPQDEVFIVSMDDVFDEAPARQLEAHLTCSCKAAGAITKHVVTGKLGFDFSSRRRLDAVEEEFMAVARKLLTEAEVRPHIQTGLQITIHNNTVVTACEKVNQTDVFNVAYKAEMDSAAAAASVSQKLVAVAKAGATFDTLTAAVSKAAKDAGGATLTMKGPPSVIEAPSTETITIAATTTTTKKPAATIDGACPPKAVGVLMGLAMLAAATN